MNDLLNLCALELAELCAENETILKNKKPFLCRLHETPGKESAIDLVDDCLEVAQELYSYSSRHTGAYNQVRRVCKLFVGHMTAKSSE